MISGWLCARSAGSLAMLVMIGLTTTVYSDLANSETCSLPSEHAGMTFPIEKVDPDRACLLSPIVDNYTTISKVGPIRSGLSELVYHQLLDRPPLAAALINRLELGLYKSEARGPGRFWGHDGEGTGGIVELVYQDRNSRIYYLEGSHDGRFLPHITGKAVVFLRMNPVTDTDGKEAMDSTMVSYTRLDNRILSGVVTLLRPFVGGTVKKKLTKGVETVNRLSLVMRQHPDRVLSKAMEPPALPDEDVAMVRLALENLLHSNIPTPSRTTPP